VKANLINRGTFAHLCRVLLMFDPAYEGMIVEWRVSYIRQSAL